MKIPCTRNSKPSSSILLKKVYTLHSYRETLRGKENEQEKLQVSEVLLIEG